MGKNDEFTMHVPRTYRRGWGVMFSPAWDDDTEMVSDVDSVIVEIDPDNVRVIGGAVCVQVGEHAFYPLDGFRVGLTPLWEDDTHDMRGRWFATEAEAVDHERDTMTRYRTPNPWEVFIRFD